MSAQIFHLDAERREVQLCSGFCKSCQIIVTLETKQEAALTGLGKVIPHLRQRRCRRQLGCAQPIGLPACKGNGVHWANYELFDGQTCSINQGDRDDFGVM